MDERGGRRYITAMALIESAKPNHDRPALNPILKLVLELGPVLVFLLANFNATRFGIAADQRLFVATGIFIVATLLSLVVHYALVRRLPIMPLVSGIVVLVFGGLTLWLHDDLFIKLKPTVVNALFGSVLLGGLLFGKSLLSVVLDSALNLTEEGWRKLTLRWGLFFYALAIINEVVWRTQSEDFWVSFKFFGFVPLTVLFALAQTPLLLRYEKKASAEPK